MPLTEKEIKITVQLLRNANPEVYNFIESYGYDMCNANHEAQEEMIQEQLDASNHCPNCGAPGY